MFRLWQFLGVMFGEEAGTARKGIAEALKASALSVGDL
jgi:hypothetical protein